MAKNPRKVKLCSKCPIYVKMPSPSVASGTRYYPYCMMLKSFLPGSDKTPIHCPMKGQVILWEK